MALSRAEEWAKAKEFVAEHADELRELDSPAAIFKFCEKKRHGGKSMWPKVRTELPQSQVVNATGGSGCGFVGG